MSRPRYTKEEKLRIKYYKARIREIPYLKYRLNMIDYELEEIDTKLHNISCLYLNPYGKLNDYNKKDKHYIYLISKKGLILEEQTVLKNDLQIANDILQGLTELAKNITIDLLVKEVGIEKVRQKYYISNPYQLINDEFKVY